MRWTDQKSEQKETQMFASPLTNPAGKLDRTIFSRSSVFGGKNAENLWKYDCWRIKCFRSFFLCFWSKFNSQLVFIWIASLSIPKQTGFLLAKSIIEVRVCGWWIWRLENNYLINCNVYSTVGFVCRIQRLHLCGGVKTHPRNHLMVRLQPWSFF